MKESVIFSGMLEVVACLIVLAEPRAVVPREYNRILLPGDLVERSHQPYDRNSGPKLFWPEKKLTYASRGKIVYYKCVNRAPGIPELVADVGYRPARFMLVNRLTITCDIYVGENNMVMSGETSPETVYFEETTPPVDTETTIQRTEGESTTWKTTELKNSGEKSSEIGTVTRTKTTESYGEAESGKTDKTTARIKGTTVKPDREIQIWETEKTWYTDEPSLKTSSENLVNGGKDEEKDGLNSEETTLRATDLKTVRTTSQKRVTRPMMDETTSSVENDDSGGEEMIEITCQGTGLVTDKIDSDESGILENEEASEIGLGDDETGLRTEKTTLKVPGPQTVESIWQNSTTSPKLKKDSPSTEVQGATTEKALEILCEEIGLGTLKPNGQDSKGEDGAGKKTEDTAESWKEFPAYKLVLKIVPLGKKRKIGLAKITYS